MPLAAAAASLRGGRSALARWGGSRGLLDPTAAVRSSPPAAQATRWARRVSRGIFEPQTMPAPVVIDTDIGDDIDDTWAIALALRCPELDVRLITTAHGAPKGRAALIGKLLHAAGRPDIPIGLGRGGEAPLAQGAWGTGFDIGAHPGGVKADGARAMADVILSSPEPVVVIALAPAGNLASALALDATIAGRASVVGMGGSVRRGYGRSPAPSAEYNVKTDAQAYREVLAAPWHVALTPLDVCDEVVLEGEEFQAVRSAAEAGDSLCAAILECYGRWAEACRGDDAGVFPASRYNRTTGDDLASRSTVLFDCAAVGLAVQLHAAAQGEAGAGAGGATVPPGGWMGAERVLLRVDEEGRTVEGAGGKECACALGWQPGGAEDFRRFVAGRLARLG